MSGSDSKHQYMSRDAQTAAITETHVHVTWSVAEKKKICCCQQPTTRTHMILCSVIFSENPKIQKGQYKTSFHLGHMQNNGFHRSLSMLS